MSGCFGYELDLNRLSPDELLEVAEQIRRVKSVRKTLLYGAFHRLLSPFEGDDTAWITVSPDRREAVFTLVRAHAQSGSVPSLPFVRLRGLDAALRYRIAETGESYGGDELMRLGLCCPLPQGDAASVSYTLRAE